MTKTAYLKVWGALAALFAGTQGAPAATVTFDWFQTSGTIAATGTLVLSSSQLTAQDASGAAQFNLTGTGATALGEVASFSFSFDGHSLSSISSNSTGWRDNYPSEPVNILESTWASSQTFGTPPVGTLQVVGNSTQYSTATFGSASATGEWVLAPVPLPASAWLMLTGVGALGFAATRRGASRVA